MPASKFGVLFLFLLAASQIRADSVKDAADIEFFEKKVRPIFVNNCYNCHSANTNSRGGLRVDDRNGLTNGGDRGPAVLPGQVEKSLLMQAVKQTHATLKMPPQKKLQPEEIAHLAKWIQDGAAWPKAEVPFNVGNRSARYERLRKEHWAWQPLADPKIPDVRDAAWPKGEIDRFVLASLEAKKLPPVADAERLLLLRRVTFDLTGLPPTPAEADAFLNDQSPAAFEKVVDRLLASSAYGERWGRHWLDVARYGESTGSSRNLPLPHAWRYRDYVIDAFRNDKPFDQFVREQIAGDLLPAKTDAQRDEQLIATGFLALGVKDVNQRFKVRFVMDNIDEQIDTVTRSILGLTASCARCHDHKFDPIPTADYYALAGIFHSTDLCAGLKNKMGGGGLDYYDTGLLLRLSGQPHKGEPIAAKVQELKNALDQARIQLKKATGANLDEARKHVKKIESQLLAMNDPALTSNIALGVRDGKKIGDTELRIRGEAEQLGPTIPRGFLTLVDVPDAPKINPETSGRLELAQWLTSPSNPLTTRVLVNRVWHHLFGRGLVSTVDNFGTTGDEPTHPELLDFLARKFVRDGWSIKKMVRAIVLSRTYRLGSETTPAHLTADPANHLVWRHSPRRLEAEEIRDASLAVAGTLDAARPEASAAKELKVIEIQNNGAEANKILAAATASKHRSVYLPLVRGLIPRSLEVFDFAEQGMVTGARDATTVAPQALYLLNDPFVRRQSLAFAQRVLKDESTDAGRIDLAYRLALNRPATTMEIERAGAFVTKFAAQLPRDKKSSNDPDEVPVADAKTTAWASFCQAILSSAEFRYLR